MTSIDLSRSYSGMIQLATFEERFDYLTITTRVGDSTFGFERWMNQMFYRSAEWKSVRQEVIARDNATDLASDDHPIYDRIIIHHIIPMRPEDLENGNRLILDPDNLITTTHNTHNAIHFGNKSLLPQPEVERRPGDTKLW